ncbi:MAG: N-6 DNA methylase [Candidatus Gracilibacteria bacterium]|nr:N-6 DNA methylase [Candidatus Gracilibacteria bacterium]
MALTKLQNLGVDKGLIEIDIEKNKITYKNLRNGEKKYKFSDPEEQVRVDYFVELVTKYQYEPENIGLEVEMPKRVPNQFADLVIFDEGVENKYFVIEFKRSDITDNEFEQAVKQGIGNGRVLKAKYYGTIAGTTMRFFEDGKDENIDDAFYSIPIKYGNPETWKYTKGGLVDLEAVTMENLKTALDKAQQTIWHGGKRNPVEAFGEVAKLIFIKISDEKKLRKKGEPYNFQRKRNESTIKLQTRINEIYEEERQKDKQVFSEPIRLDDKELAGVVEHLQNLNFNKTDLDIKGEAFQLFLGNFFKGDAGQYFTPNPVTRFCLDLFAPDMQNTDKVLDTSCGSGGFLLKALDIMREQADEYFDKDSKEHFDHWHSFAENYLYGVEISESIARVAKMNMILHDDGHTNVIAHDGLDDIEKMAKINLGFKVNTFKYIFTNPPFGSVIKKSESDYLENFELGKKDGKKSRPAQKTEILFLERIHDFLAKNGKAVVVFTRLNFNKFKFTICKGMDFRTFQINLSNFSNSRCF